MFPRMFRRGIFFLVSLLIASGPGPARAGAWIQTEGEGLLILGNSYYLASNYYDNQGKKRSQPNYGKADISLYAEYGLLSYLTVGTNLSVQYAMQDVASGERYRNYHLGDSEFFARAGLIDQDGFALAVSPLVKLPSPGPARIQPKIGSSHPDLGLGLSAGYGWDALGQHHFANLDTLYRYRFGAPHNQANINGTLGFALNDTWTLMPQAFLTYRLGKSQNAAFTLSPGDDYNLVKLQLSALCKLHRDVAMQIGLFSDVAGKNTGQGNGLVLALWSDF